MFNPQSIKMSSHTLLKYSLLSIKILASNFPDVMGTYRRLSHTSNLNFLISTFLSTMPDVNDLLVLTIGKCVIKGRVFKWPVKLYVCFFYIFFSKIQKSWLFTFFSCCTHFLKHWWATSSVISPGWARELSLSKTVQTWHHHCLWTRLRQPFHQHQQMCYQASLHLITD